MDATTDSGQVQTWWAESPAANVGIATGVVSGLVVLDVDPAHGGDESLCDLEAEQGTLPATPTALTGGGGRHLFFAHPGGRVPNRVGLRPGLDLRGDGGFVVAPPSIHASGRCYAWEASAYPNDTPLASLPAWLLHAVTAPTATLNGDRPLDVAAVLAGVPEGERDITLFHLASKLRRAGVPRKWAERLVLEAAANCVPPFPERDALAKVASAYERYAPTAVSVPPEPHLPPIEGAVRGEVLEIGGNELIESAADSPDLPFLPLLGVDGYIVEGWSHLLAGYPRSGKTDLLARLVREWLAQGKRVVYLTEEPKSIWATRLAALGDDWSGLRVVFGLGADPHALFKRAFGGEEDVVIVDTLRSLLALRDETDNSEVARVLNPWIAGARNAGKTLVMAHHMRKGAGEHGEGIAGGHALLGVFDVALELRRDLAAAQRRLLRAYARLIAPPELVYERAEDRSFRALGDPATLRLAEVQDRVYEVLTDESLKTAAVWEGLDEPRPGFEQVRLALRALARDGRADRDPPIQDGDAPGKTYRWRLSTSPPTLPSYMGGGGCSEPAQASAAGGRDENRCGVCKGPLAAFAPDGTPLCEAHNGRIVQLAVADGARIVLAGEAPDPVPCRCGATGIVPQGDEWTCETCGVPRPDVEAVNV